MFGSPFGYTFKRAGQGLKQEFVEGRTSWKRGKHSPHHYPTTEGGIAGGMISVETDGILLLNTDFRGTI